MRSTYVLRRPTAASRATVAALLSSRPRDGARLAASPIVCRSSLIGRETILVLVLEIVLGQLVHHLGICSRLIISTHLVESVEVPVTTAHAIPPVAVAASEVHHVHGRHVVHAHAHVSTEVVVHVHVVVYTNVSPSIPGYDFAGSTYPLDSCCSN
jgi:hypothetical protein